MTRQHHRSSAFERINMSRLNDIPQTHCRAVKASSLGPRTMLPHAFSSQPLQQCAGVPHLPRVEPLLRCMGSSNEPTSLVHVAHLNHSICSSSQTFLHAGYTPVLSIPPLGAADTPFGPVPLRPERASLPPKVPRAVANSGTDRRDVGNHRRCTSSLAQCYHRLMPHAMSSHVGPGG